MRHLFVVFVLYTITVVIVIIVVNSFVIVAVYIVVVVVVVVNSLVVNSLVVNSLVVAVYVVTVFISSLSLSSSSLYRLYLRRPRCRRHRRHHRFRSSRGRLGQPVTLPRGVFTSHDRGFLCSPRSLFVSLAVGIRQRVSFVALHGVVPSSSPNRRVAWQPYHPAMYTWAYRWDGNWLCDVRLLYRASTRAAGGHLASTKTSV